MKRLVERGGRLVENSVQGCGAKMGKGKYPRAGPRKILILNLNRYRRHCKVGESVNAKTGAQN